MTHHRKWLITQIDHPIRSIQVDQNYQIILTIPPRPPQMKRMDCNWSNSKELYLSWRQQSISKGVLKVMESEGSTIEYWKARLGPGLGREVNKPIAYLRKCLENDPPSEFVAPLPPHKQYTSGEWADCIES